MSPDVRVWRHSCLNHSLLRRLLWVRSRRLSLPDRASATRLKQPPIGMRLRTAPGRGCVKTQNQTVFGCRLPFPCCRQANTARSERSSFSTDAFGVHFHTASADRGRRPAAALQCATGADRPESASQNTAERDANRSESGVRGHPRLTLLIRFVHGVPRLCRHRRQIGSI